MTMIPLALSLSHFNMKATRGVPVIAKGVASCPAQAAAYGKCIAASYKDVQKDMCQKEFLAFKQCVQQAVSRWQLLVVCDSLNSIDTLDQKEVVNKTPRLLVHLRFSHHTSYQINCFFSIIKKKAMWYVPIAPLFHTPCEHCPFYLTCHAIGSKQERERTADKWRQETQN